MFWRWRSKTRELRANHIEFYNNCLPQIEDLEKRTNANSWSVMKKSFDGVWSHDQLVQDIEKKVSLARKWAADISENYRMAKVDDAARRLELLQTIIDSAEHDLQNILSDILHKEVGRKTSDTP